jgi:hypothetical protein
MIVVQPETTTLGAVAAPAPVRPGWKTTEFWLSTAATVVSALLALGIVTPSSAAEINQDVQTVAAAATMLIPVGYAIARAITKALHR